MANMYVNVAQGEMSQVENLEGEMLQVLVMDLEQNLHKLSVKLNSLFKICMKRKFC